MPKDEYDLQKSSNKTRNNVWLAPTEKKIVLRNIEVRFKKESTKVIKKKKTITKFKKRSKGRTNRRSQLCIVVVRHYKS